MSTRAPEPIDPAVEAAAERVLAKVFFGIHHVPYWPRRKAWGDNGVTVTLDCELATFDYSYLTRLVVAAHDECVRVAVLRGAGPGLLVGLTVRTREGDTYSRHPTIEEGVVRARQGNRQ